MPYTRSWRTLPRTTGPKLMKWLGGKTGFDPKRHDDFGSGMERALLSDYDTFFVAKGKKQVHLEVVEVYDPFNGLTRKVLRAELV